MPLWGSDPSIVRSPRARTIGMRRLRVLVDGAPYHAIVRANRKEHLLESPSAKTLLLTTLAQAKHKFEFRIDNFVIMENHVHLLLWPSASVGLPEIMKWTLGVFTMRYNRAFDSSGHVWGQRYFSRPIGSAEEYQKISDYIDANPVRAGLVTSAVDWEWSGFYHRLINRRDIVGSDPSDCESATFTGV